MHDIIVAAIAANATITLGYRKPNGVITVRLFEPYSVTRCGNGNTTVNGQCPHDAHPKSLTLDNVLFAVEGTKLEELSRVLFMRAAGINSTQG